VKPRVKVYVSMETGECHISYIYRFGVPVKDWLRLAGVFKDRENDLR